MIRLFIGIKIAQQQKLIDLTTSLKSKLLKSQINWVPPENFHLTLKFLGDTETYYANSISLLLAPIAHQHKSFQLAYNKPGYFGKSTQPRIIWFDFKPNGELIRLQQSVDKVLQELGFEPEMKKYHPHLTLGRVKKLNEIDIFNTIIHSNTDYNNTIEVTSFQLIESILRPEGPVYRTVEEFRLNT